MPSGIDPAKNRKPVAPINSALDTFWARRYIATGGDQIELKPPNTPENKPTPTCQAGLWLIEIVAPNIWVNENAIIAKPIAIDITALGKDKINREVRKILAIMESPKSQ